MLPSQKLWIIIDSQGRTWKWFGNIEAARATADNIAKVETDRDVAIYEMVEVVNTRNTSSAPSTS